MRGRDAGLGSPDGRLSPDGLLCQRPRNGRRSGGVVHATLIRSIHKDLDDAALVGCQSDGDPALKGLTGPVSSVEAGPFLIDVETLGQLDAGGGFPRIDEDGAFHRHLNRDGFASGNIEDVILIGRFRLSDFNDRHPLQ